jgi:peroxiredoxin
MREKVSRLRQIVPLAAAAAVFAGVVVAYLLVTDNETSTGTSGQGLVQLGMLDTPRPEVGQVAPDFALLDVRDGQTVRRLSDFRGKTVVLNWYASWCAPCRIEMPDFERAFQALDGELVVLAVNLQESHERALSMLHETAVSFPAVLDPNGEVARHYRVRGMPTTYFIDRDGIVRSSGSGLITEQALRAELEKLGHSYK